MSSHVKAELNESLVSLRDSEEKYRLLVENVNDAIVITQNEKLVYFNRQFADLLGYSYQDLMFKDFLEIYSDTGKKILLERDRKRKKKQEVPSRYETVLSRKDGTEVNVEANVTVVDYNGEKATFAVIRDITAAKLAARELAMKDQRYRLLFELSPTGLLLEDLSGVILDVNPAFCQSLGYTKEELIGQHVDILVHPDVIDQVVNNINELKKGKVLKHHEKSLRKDGSICYMELHETKISLPDGKAGILCIAHDVTEKISAEEDRVQKERMKGVLEMAGAVCHELNQPMTVVSVNSEIISENMEKPQLKERLRIIKQEIRRMSKITRKLMHITRYETREYLNGHLILDIDKSVSQHSKEE